LFPNLLDLIARKPSVPFTRRGTAALSITGQEYRRNALGQLVSADLKGSMLTEVAKVLREVPLDGDILQKFLAKCVHQFDAMDLEALPSLIYQLLLLVNRKDSVVKRLLLCSVCSYFDTLDVGAQALDESDRLTQTDSLRDPHFNTEELRSVEGTVILQINFAVTQDQRLGKDFLKLLNGSIAISPFSLALLFSLSRISYLEEEAFKLLKGAVSSCHNDESRLAGSQWISSLGTASEVSLQDMLLKTVKNSAAGWDHITQSLVKFGFVCVDSTGAFGRSAAQEYVSGIGFKIVIELFELHEIVRSAILEQCFTRIITHASSVDKVVTVLETLIKEQPQVMMAFTQQIKDLFDYVSSLSPEIAAQLLKAVQPLLRLRPELFDYVVLVFRKAVFNKEPTSRLIAVTGFVELVQLGDAAVLAGGGGGHAEQAANEMRAQAFGLFRRCLTQQYVVRERVYCSLAHMFDVSPSSREAIMELLASQWSRYYRPKDSPDDESAPFDLTDCLYADKKGLVVEEPLSALIRCIHTCCCHSSVQSARADADDEEADDSPIHLLPHELWEATDRMSSCTLDDFGLDENSDVHESSETGQRNAATVFLLQSVCEAIIECSVVPSTAMQRGKAMSLDARVKSLSMQIFGGLHDQLTTLAKSKSKPKADRKAHVKRKSAAAAAAAAGGGAAAAESQSVRSQPHGIGASNGWSKQEQSYMSFPCITQCLESLTTHKDKGTASFQDQMLPFRSFVYKTCTRMLTSLAKAGSFTEAIFKELQGLTLALVKALQSHREDALRGDTGEDSGEKGKKKAAGGVAPTVQALQCLSLVVLTVQTYFPETNTASEAKMRSLLSPCAHALGDRDAESASAQQSISDCCLEFGNLLVAMLQDGNSREPEILLGIIWTVASYMDTRSAKQCATRFDKVLSRDFKSNSVGACKAACKLLLKLNEQQGDGYLKTLRSIAVDLRGLLGSVADTDHRGDPRQYHNIVTVDSAKAVIAVVIAGVEGVMEEISWAITKLKELMVGVVELEDDFAEATAGRRKSVGADSGLVGRIEAATHSRLDKVIEVLEPLTALDMPNWASTELILRMVVKLYRELKAATKLLFVTKVSPPKSFKLVIKHAHNRIASHVYELLQILNAGGNDTAEGVAKKELALVPVLVFSMEDLEKELIKYGKQCKENLMRGHKRSTVRDFKINDEKIIDMRHDADEAAAAAAAAAEENEEEEEEDDGEEDAEHQKDENSDEDDEGEEGEEHAEDEEDDEDEADAGNRFVDDEAGGSSEENSDEEHSYGAYGGRTHQTTKRRKLRYIASPVASVLPSDEEELLDDEDEEEEDREDDDATQGEMDEEEQDSLELGSGDDADSD
jgi:Fanconi anemia group I protein